MNKSPSKICKGCWQNLHFPVALRGPFSIPFRMVGLRPSRMNPNTCTFCELAFTRIMKARNITIDATVLFADLRGYTNASQYLAPDQMRITLVCADINVCPKPTVQGKSGCATRCLSKRAVP